MSRFPLLPADQLPAAATEHFAQIKKAIGRVPNAYATIGSYSPSALGVMLGTDAVLGKGALSKADIEAVRLLVSELNGCDYCVAAHTVVGKMAGLEPGAMVKIRAGQATGREAQDALLQFVHTVQTTSGTVPAQAVDAVLAAGYSQQQIIEALLAVSMITFTNLINRVNDTELDFPRAA
jgi:uncharacterized peroxidase-related enzyme